MKKYYACVLSLFLQCNTPETTGQSGSFNKINTDKNTLKERIPSPAGFHRTTEAAGSFTSWLRNVSLKPAGSAVRYYDGREKPHKVYVAVLSMDIGTKDLQQCADAVMRLRAEYLYQHRRYDDIHFNFTSGFHAGYSQWRKGYRIKVSGNTASWTRSAPIDTSYTTFRKYLETVFSYAGSLSLSRELTAVPYADIKPGDVLIHGGSPGHAVMVVDMVQNAKGRKLFLLAQSYMPAQDIHILLNPANEALSPWYELDTAQRQIQTPEWLFETSEVMRW